MPDEVMAPQTKPAEISFSDWKKLKSALGGDDPNRQNQNKPNNYNSNNKKHNYDDHRNAYSLPYFECFKRNNHRIFNDNAGTFDELFPPTPRFNSRSFSNMDSSNNRLYNDIAPMDIMGTNCNLPQNCMGSMRDIDLSCNLPQNCMGSIHDMDSSCNIPQNCMGSMRDMVSSYNRLQNGMGPMRNIGSNFNFPQNGIGPFRNMGSSFNRNQNHIGHIRNMDSSCDYPQNNFRDFHTSPSNNFVMSNDGIPQQHFRDTYLNCEKNTFKRNMSMFRYNRFSINKKNIDTTQVKEIKTATLPSLKSDEGNQTLHADVKNAIMKVKKQPWIVKKPKPPTMSEKHPESKEEKQRMWREYRQNMKPFKNREFHNAKRVIQRLGKKNFDELDDKEKDRLTRAKETVHLHKNRLAEKAGNRWTIVNDIDKSGQSNGVVYVEKPKEKEEKQEKQENSDNVVLDNLTLPNDSGLDDSPVDDSSKMESNQYDLWNNFIPEGIVLKSPEK